MQAVILYTTCSLCDNDFYVDKTLVADTILFVKVQFTMPRCSSNVFRDARAKKGLKAEKIVRDKLRTK